MRLTVFLEHRFLRAGMGPVLTAGPFASPFWDRYLRVFDAVRVVARVQDVAEWTDGLSRADSDRVRFTPLPFYIGPREYVTSFWPIRRVVRSVVASNDALLLRVPSPIAALVERSISRARPYGLEVVGNPHEVFSPGVNDHVLRPLLRTAFVRHLRRQCTNASSIGYVAGHLQAGYPPGKDTFCLNYSDVELPLAAFRSEPRSERSGVSSFTIVTVGSMEQPYKGVDDLIGAVDILVNSGLDLRLVVVGEGRYRTRLEHMVRQLSLDGRVSFLGQVPSGEPVRQALDTADLFVLASRTEGLPRAMIEAMARGLPCLGTRVGGIPELLSDEVMVSPGQPDELAKAVRAVLTDPARMSRLSAENLAKAHSYAEAELIDRRTMMYEHLRRRTARFIETRT